MFFVTLPEKLSLYAGDFYPGKLTFVPSLYIIERILRDLEEKERRVPPQCDNRPAQDRPFLYLED